jgi:hypothetical protein
VLDLLASAVEGADELPPYLAEPLAALPLLSDEALWRAARSRLSPEAAEELENLHFKRQREGRSRAEAQRARFLLRQYDRAMLIRAHAAALLKQRGHDVDVLLAEA